VTKSGAAQPVARKKVKTGVGARLGRRFITIFRTLGYFLSAKRWFFAPILILLLVAGILLLLTGGLSYVAPFVYTFF
jgi:hypothetical protein